MSGGCGRDEFLPCTMGCSRGRFIKSSAGAGGVGERGRESGAEGKVEDGSVVFKLSVGLHGVWNNVEFEKGIWGGVDQREGERWG